MKFKLLPLMTLIALLACHSSQQETVLPQKGPDTVAVQAKPVVPQQQDPANNSVKILWWEEEELDLYEEKRLSLFINEAYCKTLPEPQRAALGFVATFYGGNCHWDTGKNQDSMRCGMLRALDLGYQCSNKHLSYLRHWFRNDSASLNRLDACNIIPDGATVQEIFGEIVLIPDGNYITVNTKVNGIDIRAQQTWSFQQSDIFRWENDEIHLVETARAGGVRENMVQ